MSPAKKKARREVSRLVNQLHLRGLLTVTSVGPDTVSRRLHLFNDEEVERMRICFKNALNSGTKIKIAD